MAIYTIKTGNHSASGLHFGVHFGIKGQSYKVNFSKECLYAPLDWENDYNKLCGWSYGMHHANSIRIGWRPFMPLGSSILHYTPTSIELCIYVYENHTRRLSEKTLVVNVERGYTLDLKYITETNTVLLNVPELGNSTSMDYVSKPFLGYRLYPFFGGNIASPKNMTIELHKL